MMINGKIEYLHRVIMGGMAGDIVKIGIFDRLFAWGVIALYNDINSDLEELSIQLDTELNLEAVSIKFDLYINRKYWTNNWLYIDYEELYRNENIEKPRLTYTTQINTLTDYLPNGVKGYNVNPAVINSFKTAMHQLCDEDRLTDGDIFYSLNAGLNRMLDLLKTVQNKVKNPQNHLYKKLWDETYEIYDNDEAVDEFNEWVEEIGSPTFEDLKARQKQEIFKLLSKNFFRFYNNPTGAEVKKCKLFISEDDLPFGTHIPENIVIECAKFEKFIEWKGEHILSINYEKLGQYIYKHYQEFEKAEFFVITDFERNINAIHEAMALINPKLSMYLKDYEEKMVARLVDWSVEILSTCKQYLNAGVEEAFLRTYMEKLLYDKEMKEEARKKLSGSSKFTFIGNIVAQLINVRIFMVGVDIKDLAHSLREKITDISEDTIVKNIQRPYNANSGALYDWTLNNIDTIKQQSNNPFAGII